MSLAPARPVAIPIPVSMPSDDYQPEPIQSSEEYIRQLQNLTHFKSDLQKAGYVMQQPSQDYLDRKRRCFLCSRHLPIRLKKTNWLPKTPVQRGSNNDDDDDEEEDLSQRISNPEQTDSSKRTKKTVLHCKYHSGRVIQRKWTCCNGTPSSPPCQGKEDHTPKIYAAGELEKEWKYFHTPNFQSRGSPAIAVVIDCEMGTASTGESELIRVSAVDYFSGKILLDKLVYPDVKMIHFNTRYSGVTRQDMENAKRRRSCLMGRSSARKALWQFIGPNTVVVGHGANSDLTSLRWIHPAIIDTYLIEKANRPPEEDKQDKQEGQAAEVLAGNQQLPTEETNTQQGPDEKSPDEKGPDEKGPAAPKQRGGLSLKALAKERLGREIQVKGQGHDSVEDSIAARDILHWNVCKLLESINDLEPMK
ncbi:ribonuclease H-like domain-containing protein [Trichoderma chlorosporum]